MSEPDRRFLFCDSTYRNRNLYPYQADFVIPFSKSVNPQTYNQVDDIVMKGTIVYIWTGGNSYTGTTGSYSGNGSYYSEGTFKTGTTDSLPLLHQTNNSTVSLAASIEFPINDTVSYPPVAYVVEDGIEFPSIPFWIPTPSDTATGYPNALPLITYSPDINALLLPNVVSASGVIGVGPTTLAAYTDYYKGCGIVDVNTNERRLILTYTPSIAGVSMNTALFNTSIGDQYVIYEPSNNNDSLIHLNTYDAMGRPIIVIENAFTNFYLIDETLTAAQYDLDDGAIVSRKIIAYDYTTQLATLESPFPSGWKSTDVYTLREKLPDEWHMIFQVTPLPNEQLLVLLPYYASAIDNYYANRFMYKLPIMGGWTLGPVYVTPSSSLTDFYYIISYNGTTREAVVQPMRGSGTLISGNLINICSFSMDNEQPLLYSGSIVSQSEEVSYQVSIYNLVVPNVNMSTGPRVVQYPFVYVGLQVVDGSSSGNNIITYSNNPYSRKALFLVTTSNTTIPQISPFLKTDSGSSTVTIKIKPNASLRFTMWLPDGTLYKTQEIDSFSPYQPNALLQIACTFCFTRL